MFGRKKRKAKAATVITEKGAPIADVDAAVEAKDAPIQVYNSWFEAFFKPSKLWASYKHFTADALVSKWNLGLPLLLGAGLGLAIGILVFYMGALALLEALTTYTGQQFAGPGYDFTVPSNINYLWGTFSIFAGVFFGLWLVASIYIYRKSHMLTHVFEFANSQKPWHPTSMLILSMPRKHFWRRPDAIFGPPNRAGVMNGEAYLALPPGVSIHTLRKRAQIAALDARVPKCSEHNPKQAAQVLEMGKEMGKAIFSHTKRSPMSILKSNVGFVFCAVMTVIAVVIMNMGDSAPDLSVPPPGVPPVDGEFGGTSGMQFLIPLARIMAMMFVGHA